MLSAGCGLSHYQQQMAEEQARAESLEMEPLQLPQKQGQPNVFFRPPKGITLYGSNQEGSLLQRFPVAKGATSPFASVDFGVESMKDDAFWPALLRLFPGKEKGDLRHVEKTGARKIPFEELVYDDGQTTSYVYVHSQGESRVVIVFRLDRGKRDDSYVRKIMDWSLGTLLVGADAARVNDAIKKHASEQAVKRKQAESDDQ